MALAVATRGWGLRERGKMLIIGVPILFLLHILDLVTHFPMYFPSSGITQVIAYSMGVGGVAMPFVIWVVFAFFFRKETSTKTKEKRRKVI